MKYRLYVPKQAVGASLVYFDLFNASGSTSEIELLSLLPVVSGAVAVNGVVGVDLHLTRTTDVGTGGTAAVAEGTDTTLLNLCAHDHTAKISPSITARLTPAGGATAGATLAWRCVFTEETSSAAYAPAVDMARSLYADVSPILIPEGTGIRVVQGTVASVGNIGFDVLFNVRAKAGS